MNLENLEEINQPLLLWYQENKRDLPWRKDPTPYHVWVSEIMLQQTRVEAVKEYYLRFISELPTIQSLASVSEERLLKLWEGLGYYSRARNLQKSAVLLVEQCGGELPQTYEALLALPGIGEYTAGAILSIAYGQAIPAIDGNVLRVMSRLGAIETEITNTKFKKELQQIIRETMPQQKPGDYNQALMELGATVCIPNGKPLCNHCPLFLLCEARKQNVTHIIPVKPKKKQRKIEERTILLLTNQDMVAINKRNQKGVLSGMWEFPNLENWLSEEEAMQYVFSMGYQVHSIQKLPAAKHIFTHIEWHMIGYHIVVSNKPSQSEFQFITQKQMQEEIALPSAFRCYNDYFMHLR